MQPKHFLRQRDILNNQALETFNVSLIGAGSVGSFIALTITKMGVKKLKVFDDDGVSDVNIPNQFYPLASIGNFKALALKTAILDFCGVGINFELSKYKRQRLGSLVIVATDSMSSRKVAWEQFIAQPQTKWFIETRMGAELGIVYCVNKKDRKFYEETLYSSEEAEKLPCTARTIIYNVLLIASIVARAVKGIVQKEKQPREFVFNMQDMHSEHAAYMTRR